MDKSVCRKTGTSHQNSVNISEASPTRAVGVLPCRIVSTHHSSVRQLQSATTLEGYGVQEEASDSETEPESDDMCTDPCSVSRSHASRRLESLHSTILGIGRKSQKSQQQPQDDEDSATEPESDDTVSGVTPIMRREPEPQHVKSPKQMDLDEGSSVPVSQSDDSATEPESDDLPPTLSLLVNLQMSAHVGRSSRPPQDGGDASQVGVGVSSHHVESPRAVSFELQDGSSSLISDTPFSIPSQDLGDIRGTNYWNGSESDSLPSVVAEFLGMFEDDGGMFDDE